MTSRLAGSSTVYVNPVRLRKSSAWRCRSARFSSGVISRGQPLSSHPGVAWMCSRDEAHASQSWSLCSGPSGSSTNCGVSSRRGTTKSRGTNSSTRPIVKRWLKWSRASESSPGPVSAMLAVADQLDESHGTLLGRIQAASYTRSGLGVAATSIDPRVGFAGTKPPPEWPPPRGRPRPAALARTLDVLPGVGPALRRKLARLGLETIRDLLEHRPRRYESAVPERRIAELREDEEVTITAEVLSVGERRRGRLKILTARIADESGPTTATWFNQPWLKARLVPGTRVRLRGKSGRYGFDVRSYDLGEASATADFAPVYPATEDIPPGRLRGLVEAALPHAVDFLDALPAETRGRLELPLLPDALTALHRPRDHGEAELARRRLAFDELLVLQLGLARRTRERERERAPALGAPRELTARYLDLLPFELTPHQRSAIAEIDADLAGSTPMQRLLQGDVGSGKTVVALYALLRAVENGSKGALMAPTETLAEQHFLTIEGICAELGVRVGLLTGSVKGRGEDAQIVVGTHALIQEGVDLGELAVAVVDEQHRFGVEQRKALVEGRTPHVLHMTATPIPRTLALTVYGDLAVSEIAKPPANRKPIVTRWIPEERAPEAYRRLRRARGAWGGAVVLPARVAGEGGADGGSAGAAGGARRDDGRVRARGARPGDPRRGAAVGDAPVGAVGSEVHAPAR